MQRLDNTRGDGAKASIELLTAGDREKMAALDDATLAGWVRGGLMALIDAHLASLGNMAAVAKDGGREVPLGRKLRVTL